MPEYIVPRFDNDIRIKIGGVNKLAVIEQNAAQVCSREVYSLDQCCGINQCGMRTFNKPTDII